MKKLIHSLLPACAVVSAILGACALPFAATAADPAAAWPDKPVRLIIPAPAGGGADFIARTVSVALSEAWGQAVNIEPKPGGGGVIATSYVAKSKPDGYTLLGGYTFLIQMPAMRGDLPYDAWTDLVPISQLVSTDDLFIVPAALPVKTLDEFIKYAKANPNKLSLGSYGNGSSSHLHGELFKRQAGLDLTHVPFQGGVPLLTALMGNQVTAGFVDVSGSRTHLSGGRIRVLASTGRQRSPLLPDVPTFTELGYREFEPSGFMGLFAPAGTPPAVVNKISADVQKYMRRADIAKRYLDAGLVPTANSPADFTALMRNDAKVWGDIARASAIRIAD